MRVDSLLHRKWREIQLQPGTAGPGNMLGCCLIYFHFLWGKLSTRTVQCTVPETVLSSKFSSFIRDGTSPLLVCDHQYVHCTARSSSSPRRSGSSLYANSCRFIRFNFEIRAARVSEGTDERRDESVDHTEPPPPPVTKLIIALNHPLHPSTKNTFPCRGDGQGFSDLGRKSGK